eukprot:scaffold33434_cov71-Phaeocystis_antarctica.AAC.2
MHGPEPEWKENEHSVAPPSHLADIPPAPNLMFIVSNVFICFHRVLRPALATKEVSPAVLPTSVD